MARTTIVVALMAALCACGDSEQASDPPSTTPAPATGLAFALPDGTTKLVDPTTVSCVPSEYDEAVEVVQIHEFGEDYNLKVVAVPADVEGGKTFDLPVSPASAFVFYGQLDFIEVSTAGENASGTITVELASCDPVALELTIDATLDSEYFDGESVEVTGHLELTG